MTNHPKSLNKQAEEVHSGYVRGLEMGALVAESFEDGEFDRLSRKTRHLTAQAIAKEIRALISQHSPQNQESTGGNTELAADRQFIAGAQFGWNCGITNSRDKFDDAMKSIRGEIHEHLASQHEVKK